MELIVTENKKEIGRFTLGEGRTTIFTYDKQKITVTREAVV